MPVLAGALEAKLVEVFADFQALDAELQWAKETAMQYCRDMATDKPPYWLSFLGVSGIGKTHLMRRINRFFQKYLEAHIDKRASTPRRLVRKYGGVLEWPRCVELMVAESDFGFMRQAREDWFLALDDVGAEHRTHRELSAAKLYNILAAREERWTVITANLTLEQVKAVLDARIASRMLRNGAKVLEVQAPDWNMRADRNEDESAA